MKMNAYVAGVGMVPFGKHLDKTLKGLAGQAIQSVSYTHLRAHET